VHGIVARGREFAHSSDAVVSQRKHNVRRESRNADIVIFLGAHDEEIQLEEGLTRSRGGFRAGGDVDGVYYTDIGHILGDCMPEYPEYVHLRYRQVTVRQNVSREI